MEWKVVIPKSFEERNTMPIDRSKAEALRRIAEELEKLNGKIDCFESIAVELGKLNTTLENLNFNLVKG